MTRRKPGVPRRVPVKPQRRVTTGKLLKAHVKRLKRHK